MTDVPRTKHNEEQEDLRRRLAKVKERRNALEALKMENEDDGLTLFDKINMDGEPINFTYEHIGNYPNMRAWIEACEGKHVQQVSYSTYHKAITQVCFGCRKVRSMIKIKECNP